MKKSIVSLSLFAALMLSSTAIAQTPPPKPTTPDAVVAAFKAAGLEAESPVPLARTDYGKAPFVCKGVRFEMPSLSEDSAGRAFYCARKADRDRLARYYTSLGQQNPELFWHVFVSPPYVVQLSGDLADEQAAKYEAALMQIGSSNPVVAAAPVAPANSGFAVEIIKAGYENWGRPKLMDNPKHPDCNEADDKQALLKLGMSLNVMNTGTQPWPTGTRSWKFYKTDGTEAFSCYYDYMSGKPYPETPPGTAYGMSVLVFVQRNERVGYGIFKVEGVGEMRFDVPQNLPMP